MGNLLQNHGEEIQERLCRDREEAKMKDKELKCPECGSTELLIEKSPYGYTRCNNCNRVALHGDFYKIMNKEEAQNASLDELCHPAKVIYADDYGKVVTEFYDYIEANGGDGTLLKAINLFKHKNKPFFGTAGGSVNFLMNPEQEIAKKAKYKKFTLMKVKVTYSEYEPQGNTEGEDVIKTEIFQAFNDVMIGGDMNSWISFDVHDRDHIIGKFKGGGVVISTAQGSTGINRNNNGAIMPLSSDQWFVTGDKTNRRISVPIEPKRTSITTESRTPVKVWVDGTNHVIDNVQKIEISKGEKVTVIFNDYAEFKRKRRV